MKQNKYHKQDEFKIGDNIEFMNKIYKRFSEPIKQLETGVITGLYSHGGFECAVIKTEENGVIRKRLKSLLEGNAHKLYVYDTKMIQFLLSNLTISEEHKREFVCYFLTRNKEYRNKRNTLFNSDKPFFNYLCMTINKSNLTLDELTHFFDIQTIYYEPKINYDWVDKIETDDESHRHFIFEFIESISISKQSNIIKHALLCDIYSDKELYNDIVKFISSNIVIQPIDNKNKSIAETVSLIKSIINDTLNPKEHIYENEPIASKIFRLTNLKHNDDIIKLVKLIHCEEFFETIKNEKLSDKQFKLLLNCFECVILKNDVMLLQCIQSNMNDLLHYIKNDISFDFYCDRFPGPSCYRLRKLYD